MTTRLELETQAQKVRQELDTLEGQLAGLPEVQERWQPPVGAYYHYVRSTGVIAQAKQGNEWNKDLARRDMGNMFRTRAEAEVHKLRLESMANRWQPEEFEKVCQWNFATNAAMFFAYRHERDMEEFAVGNIHPSSEVARAWYDRYGKAFEALIK